MSFSKHIETAMRQSIVNEIEFRQKQIDLFKDTGLLSMVGYHREQKQDAERRLKEFDAASKG